MMHFRRIGSSLRAWSQLIPLFLLLLGSYWLTLQVQPLPPLNKEMRHEVDFVVENLSSTSLNEQGQPKFTLSAKKMWHFPDDDTTHLELPQFTSPHAGQPPLNINSLTGKLTHKGDEVFLYDDVVVLRAADKKTSERKFQTDYLHIIPDKDFAETDHPVLMTDANNVVNAVGMELDNRTHVVKLLSHVKATHVSKP
jgi:lipopolysaccharide export system protein LptC